MSTEAVLKMFDQTQEFAIVYRDESREHEACAAQGLHRTGAEKIEPTARSTRFSVAQDFQYHKISSLHSGVEEERL